MLIKIPASICRTTFNRHLRTNSLSGTRYSSPCCQFFAA